MTADNIIIFQKTYNYIEDIYPVISNFQAQLVYNKF